MNPMYASNSSTVICCHVLNFSPRHSDAYLLLWYTMWSRTEVVKKMSLMLVGMSTRGPVCWLKGSREKDVSSDDHCMFSALWLKRKGRAQPCDLCNSRYFQCSGICIFLHSLQVSTETGSSLCGRACTLHGWVYILCGWACSLCGWVCSLHKWVCFRHGRACSLNRWPWCLNRRAVWCTLCK